MNGHRKLSQWVTSLKLGAAALLSALLLCEATPLAVASELIGGSPVIFTVTESGTGLGPAPAPLISCFQAGTHAAQFILSSSVSGGCSSPVAGIDAVIEYGPTTAYGSTFRAMFSFGIIAPRPSRVTLTNLMPNTVYHYRIGRAWVPGHGTLSLSQYYYDSDQTFVTQPELITVPVAVKWDAAPDISGSSVKLVTFGNPAINSQGHAAFQATFSESQSKSATQSGIWVETGTDGVLTQVARTGISTPYFSGSTQLIANFIALSDPVLNTQDQVAFLGTWKAGDAVTRANHQGIWVTSSSGALTLVGQIRGQAPGCPDGTVFSSFLKLALLDNGGVVFIASLAKGPGGVVWGNDQGIWAMSETGQLSMVVREGDLLPVGSGTKKIAALSIFNSDISASGQTRSFSSNRDLIYKAIFVDGSQGLYTVVLP